MKRAWIYLRVSTSDQGKRAHDAGEGYSIPAQRDACWRAANDLNANVDREYVDKGESARSADRPGLQRMLSELASDPPPDYVIVHRIDRLARNRVDDVQIEITIRKAGAKLISVTENIDDTPSGRLLHSIMSGLAEYYSANLGREVRKGSLQKARMGGTPNRAPIGYLNVRKIIDGQEIRTVELDPERAPLIRLAFELYATGDYTLRQLLDELTRRGLVARPTKKYAAKPIVLSKLAHVLNNPYYIGVVTYAGEAYEGKHEPLISKELFYAVQKMLEAKHLAGEKQRVHQHYLKGSIYCSRCQSRMSLTLAKGKYLYFYCLGRQQRGECDQPYIQTEAVEEAVERAYDSIQLEPHRIAELRNDILTGLKASREDADKERTRQQRRVDRIRHAQQKLMAAHYEGAIDLDLLKTEQTRLKDELDDAQVVLSSLDIKHEQAEIVVGLALDLAGNCSKAYAEASPTVRRRWNQAFFTKLYIEDDEIVDVELAQPFRSLLADDLKKTYYRRKSAGLRPALRVIQDNPPTEESFGRSSREALLVGRQGLEP